VLYRAFYLTRPPSMPSAVAWEPSCALFHAEMLNDIDLIDRFSRCIVPSKQNVMICVRTSSRRRLQHAVRRYGSGGGRGRATQSRAIIRRVIELMQTHYSENLCLDDLARVAGLTRFHLIRLFKGTVGSRRMRIWSRSA